MESISKQYERDLEFRNEILARKIEDVECILEDYDNRSEAKERRYKEVIKESLDTIYQLVTELHKSKSISESCNSPSSREVEKVGLRYLKNFIKYSLTNKAMVCDECKDIVDDFIEEIHSKNAIDE